MTITSEDLAGRIEHEGFALVPNVIDAVEIERLKSVLSTAIPKNKRAGTRSLLLTPEVRVLATKGGVFDLVDSQIGPGARPVRGILFDKQPGANWDLGWHQDRAIAVRERRDVPEFIGWSEKEGVPHVLPPAEVLETMLTIRVHLDDCGSDNAPLRVSPKTHRSGLVDKSLMKDKVLENGEVVCICKAGDALLMRPLLLHASSAAIAPTHRRVVHIEYASKQLPGGLEWSED